MGPSQRGPRASCGDCGSGARQSQGQFQFRRFVFKGLDICLEANRINRLLNKSKKKDKQIQAAFENLPIKTADELAFSKNDLKYLLKSYDAYDEIIYENILRKVLLGELANNYQEIRNFAFESLKTYYGEAVAQNLSAEPAPAPTVAEEPRSRISCMMRLGNPRLSRWFSESRVRKFGREGQKIGTTEPGIGVEPRRR